MKRHLHIYTKYINRILQILKMFDHNLHLSTMSPLLIILILMQQRLHPEILIFLVIIIQNQRPHPEIIIFIVHSYRARVLQTT